ncbi:unnamed protein product [Rotaria magnacalcarata]|uniref:Uncharacterized protein n=1 Tax=Rotaria magnacalcarata TaxID=392030 RepID=A0A817AQQ6_9BILA|nr:unnamed protein product [Rotaria magnacalcarata]
MDNNENVFHEYIIQDCLSDLISQVANLVKVNDVTVIGGTASEDQNQNYALHETVSKSLEFINLLMSDSMKML